MGPTKLVIAAMAAFLTMAPVALAEDAAEAAAPAAEAAMPAADGAGLAESAAPAPEPMAPVADPIAVGASDPDTDEAVAEVVERLESEAAALDAASATPPAAIADTEPLAEPSQEASGVDAASGEAAGPTLGAIGYDSQGRRGRIHIVVGGDTLWDISHAYLGTPWVWPSIWKDNDDIENPHLIHPGDHIWITPNEMRRLTPEEAALLLSNRPPAAPEDAELPLDEMPVPTSEPVVTEAVDRGSIRVSPLETVGLVTEEQLEAAASIVGRIPERLLLTQEDEVYVGLGEGAVEPGDQLTIFRTHEKVFDPDTRRLLGYHVEFLGYVEVREVHPETSVATIEMSTGDIEKGDLLMPREPLPLEIPLQPSPQGVEGKISFFPSKRVLMGHHDFVYLNRGSLDGLEVGSPLEVFRPGKTARDASRDERVEIPDLSIADLVVVRVDTQSSVALVRHTRTELALGDRFRGF